MKAIQRATSLAALAALCLVASCAWRPYTGDLRPSVEEMQGPNMSVADDGTITWIQDRLEVRLRPVTDAELNRQFGGGDRGPARCASRYRGAVVDRGHGAGVGGGF